MQECFGHDGIGILWQGKLRSPYFIGLLLGLPFEAGHYWMPQAVSIPSMDMVE
jgi:hypothetical protein